MTEPQKDSPLIKLLTTIIGLLVIIILLLLGWKITKLQFLGVELAPPATSTIESLPISIPTSLAQSIQIAQPTLNYPTAPISIITNSDINNLLGTGNWFCLPDIQDAIGVIQFPQGFVVKHPIGNIDSSGGKYNEGEIVRGTSGTAWLISSLPLSECPPEQQVALNNWRTQSSIPITRELINSVIGTGNWGCTSASWNVTVKSFPANWVVQFPFTSADINGKKFGVGYAVSGGSSGTLNMVSMPKEQCP